MTALDNALSIPILKAEHPHLYKTASAELAALRNVAEAVQRMREKLDEHGFLGIVLAISELDEITKG